MLQTIIGVVTKFQNNFLVLKNFSVNGVTPSEIIIKTKESNTQTYSIIVLWKNLYPKVLNMDNWSHPWFVIYLFIDYKIPYFNNYWVI